MAEEKETPEPAEESGGEAGAEQGGSAEQPASVEQAPTAEQPEGVQEGQVAEEVSKDARTWAMFCHLAGLAGLIMPVVGNIVAPLIIWQIKKDDYPFVDEQGKEAVNFQISMSLYGVVGSVACLITCIGAILIPFLIGAVYIVALVFLLIAAVKANNGEHYRYPLCIRLIK
jgi:uncharacterized Tic20 family protein